MKQLLLTHDLACAFGELSRAARRHAAALDPDLMRAAVAFAVQLAIDTTGRDPAEMRALERDLLAKLDDAR